MKTLRWMLTTMVAAGAAFAQPPQLPSVTQPDTSGTRPLVTDFGLVISIGGGVQQYFGTPARAQVRTGGTWTGRVEAGSRLHVGAELAYIGSVQGLLPDESASLFSNGAQGLVRVNILTGYVRPYLGGGLTYQHFSSNTSDAVINTNTVGYAGAAGVAFRFFGVVLDARGAINGPLSDSPLTDSNGIAWSLGATVGYEL